MTYGTAVVDSVLILSVFNPPLSEGKEGWVFPWIRKCLIRVLVALQKNELIQRTGTSEMISVMPPTVLYSYL